MRIIKIVAISLLFLITAPTLVSVISSIYDVESSLVCCEKPVEEESEEKKSQKELDDLEEYLLSKNEFLSQANFMNCSYSFRGKHFIDIVSDIVTPPPEA